MGSKGTAAAHVPYSGAPLPESRGSWEHAGGMNTHYQSAEINLQQGFVQEHPSEAK